MKTLSKRKKLIPFLICMLLALTTLTLLNEKPGHIFPYYLLSPKGLSVLMIGAIVFSLWCLVLPWYMERFLLPLWRKNLVPGRVSHEARFLLGSYTLLYDPIIFGMVLNQSFDFPIAQVNYFIWASILGMAAWCVYTLRNNAMW